MNSSYKLWSILLTACFISLITINMLHNQHLEQQRHRQQSNVTNNKKGSKSYNKNNIIKNNHIKELFLDSSNIDSFRMQRRQQERERLSSQHNIVVTADSGIISNNINVGVGSIRNNDNDNDAKKENKVETTSSAIATHTKKKSSFVSGGFINFIGKKNKQQNENALQKEDKKGINISRTISTKNNDPANNNNHNDLSGLSCDEYGGPNSSIDYNTKIVNDMIYWSDIPTDSKYKSPFFGSEKYITFEPDDGGWNNIRMSMETILVLAYATVSSVSTYNLCRY